MLRPFDHAIAAFELPRPQSGPTRLLIGIFLSLNANDSKLPSNTNNDRPAKPNPGQNDTQFSRNAHNGKKAVVIERRKSLELSRLTSGCVRRPPCEDFAAREHGRCDAAAFMKFGENHRNEVERYKDRQGIER